MFNEDSAKAKGIGPYYLISILFHIALITAIIYFSLRFKPQIQSLGSRVVVSVVSRIPGPPVSVKSLMRPHPIPPVKKAVKVVPAPHPVTHKAVIPIVKSPSSMVYPKKIRPKRIVRQPVKQKPIKPQPAPPETVNPNIYASLHNRVVLNNAYSKFQQSIVAGSIHKFQSYSGKLLAIIESNFNIPLKKYLHFKSVVGFQISKTGKIYNIRLIRPSGSGYFDSQSIEAVKSSSPLPPPPKGFMSFLNSQNDEQGVLVNFNPKEILKNR